MVPPIPIRPPVVLEENDSLSARLCRKFGIAGETGPAAAAAGLTQDDSPGHDTDSEDSEGEDEDNPTRGRPLPEDATCFFKTTSTMEADPSAVSLGDFELLRVIGQGAFGKAWKVLHRSTGLPYAMKTMSKRHFLKQNMVGLLKAEKSTMSALRHPFLVSLRWAFQTRSRAFLVMDYIPGGVLSRHLWHAPDHRFPEAQARFYTAQVVLAYEHLHRNNILYRDMKPDNIVLDKDGYAKLIDFGLARPLRAPTDQAGGGKYFGMPNFYLTPEMLRGEPFGLEADWWMLGVVVYQMLTGTFPWTGTNPQLVHAEILSDAPVLVPEEYGLSLAACDFLKWLLAKDQGHRLQSASEVKRHPWLWDVDWDRLLAKELPPPFVPPPERDDDAPPERDRRMSYCRAPSTDFWIDEFALCREGSQQYAEED